ncbi:MAG: phosphate acyltransferase [Candidatus Omnitrophota bacterium]
MDTIKKIREAARKKQKTVILPEYNDKRVIEAARIIQEEGIAKVILFSPDMVSLTQKDRYINEFYKAHNDRDWTLDRVKEVFKDTLYYAAMMTAEGKTDGIVAGAVHTTPDMARAAIRCLGIDSRITIVSSCFIMVVPGSPYGEEGTFVFADCGIIPDPNARQLSCIVLAASDLAAKVLNIVPRVALLSYSTKGSARAKDIDKIAQALAMLKETAPDLLVDGELQVDAAIVPEVAKIKYPDSPLGGKANVLIFPNLEAGNIGYKLVQRLSNARALGPLLLGMNKPASDLSRGCLVQDVVDCVAVTAIRAQ